MAAEPWPGWSADSPRKNPLSHEDRHRWGHRYRGNVFEFDFRTIAEMLEVSVASARQLASRARRRIAAARKTSPQATRAERERLLRTFKATHEQGDFAGPVSLLHPDVVYLTDGGGRGVRCPQAYRRRRARGRGHGPGGAPMEARPHRPRRGEMANSRARSIGTGGSSRSTRWRPAAARSSDIGGC